MMLLFLLLLGSELILISCMFSNGTYKAAVVEYSPAQEPYSQPEKILESNTEEYVKLIIMAGNKGASIIVFPEYGITHYLDVKSKNKHQISNYSIPIPSPSHKPNPCINESLHQILRLLSCAAKDSNMYVVANLIEKQMENNIHHYYNTDIVFDRKGTIITRYRKINLFKERHYRSSNDLVTFTTDFGVTFGMLIGYDIFYKRPGLEVILEKNVTDILYSSSWASETPYFHALTVQAGYARATGVNLLAAGLSEPSASLGGSGIYLFDGRIAELYISPTKSRKLLVQDVPKIRIRMSAVKCNNNSHVMPRFRLGGNLNLGSFSTHTENMSAYSWKPLSKYGLETKAELCNANRIYCCRFHVVLKESLKHVDLKYKLSLFHGVRKFGDTTVGVRWCGLTSCTNNNVNSCGYRSNKTENNVVFEKISITGKFERSSYNYDQPATLTHDFTPITEYTYCETLSDSKKKVKTEMITTQAIGNILSFGIQGRLFGYDGLSEGIITNSNSQIAIDNFSLLYLLALIFVL